MTAAIMLRDVGRRYIISDRQKGVGGAIKHLVRPTRRTIEGLSGINLEVETGTILGLLGPNGAGKTTLLKLVAGLTRPSQGSITVLGRDPSRRSREHLESIGLITGNRYSLLWDLPARDSFELNRVIFGVSQETFGRRLKEFSERLDATQILNQPVRTLSLGQRMKVELIGGLLHAPSVVLLDEPTLGLDATTQRNLRQFIDDYRTEYEATFVLTSHYMEDIVALADRVAILHKGMKVFDGTLEQLRAHSSPQRTIRVTGVVGIPEGIPREYVTGGDQGSFSVVAPQNEVANIVGSVFRAAPGADIVVSPPALEEIVDKFYA